MGSARVYWVVSVPSKVFGLGLQGLGLDVWGKVLFFLVERSWMWGIMVYHGCSWPGNPGSGSLRLKAPRTRSSLLMWYNDDLRENFAEFLFA